jgi:hypothetical protein
MTNVTVTEIREIARSLNVKGAAKLRKAELIVAIGDMLYAEAKSEDNARKPVEVAPTVKSYNERMESRLSGYYAQNGHGDKVTYANYDLPFMLARLTAAQRRRLAKKTGKQYATLVKRNRSFQSA